MKDLRTNKTQLYIITEETCCNYSVETETYVFDNEEAARKKFNELVLNDKAFLKEEERDDVIDETENCYESYPEGWYDETHYSVTLSKTK